MVDLRAILGVMRMRKISSAPAGNHALDIQSAVIQFMELSPCVCVRARICTSVREREKGVEVEKQRQAD
jgi:hypothetical protein